MTDLSPIWNRACEVACAAHGLNRAELDRGLEAGRFHLKLSMTWRDGWIDGDVVVGLEPGPAPREQ